MPKAAGHNRLPRNFHKTFKPERQYINAMLRYAASDEEGDYQAIAASTGIPTGTSSGKVPAILDYCRGMGLIRLAVHDRSSIKNPDLTPFGRIVLLEDPLPEDQCQPVDSTLKPMRPTQRSRRLVPHLLCRNTESRNEFYQGKA